MHLDERLEKSREALRGQLAVGRQKASSAFNNLWAEMEAMREAQRKKAEEARLKRESEPPSPVDGKGANLQDARARAGAYLNSWGAWASEKKKGWQASRSASATPMSSPPPIIAEPTPGDIKRAEAFPKGKEHSGVPLSGTRAAPPSVEGARSQETKRESLFFDAEKEEKGTTIGANKDS